MTSGRDLRDQMDNQSVADAFSFLLSGKKGYKTVIERKKDIPKCNKCGFTFRGEEKFCPECGEKSMFGAPKVVA